MQNLRSTPQNAIRAPLSDPTEEKAWHRLLHRAWNAANRHPKEPTHDCRLGCGCNWESMLHMIECPTARPFFTECLAITRRVLGAPTRQFWQAAVIFGMQSNRKLLPEAARAFLRHALNVYYRDVTARATRGSTMHWTATIRDALLSLKKAVLRFAEGFRLLHTHRTHTALTAVAPDADRNRFPALVAVKENGAYTLLSLIHI